MDDLKQAQIEALAKSAGVPLVPEDVEQVTHGYNAFLRALAELNVLDLPNEPMAHPPLPDTGAHAR